MSNFKSLRGLVDLLPNETERWHFVEHTARNHFARAGFSEIRTPLIESTTLFSRSIGEGTDVVGKEMYTFTDKGERSCTLRPEGTASVVRSVLQNGLLSQGPQKLWYSGPMFRYERPQAGRQRQFHQIGIECIGLSSSRSDAELISIGWDLLIKLGLSDLSLEINTLGTKEDRSLYREKLVSWLEKYKDDLDKDSQNRLYTNPLRILDSKNTITKSIIKEAPKISESLSVDSQKRFMDVTAYLEDLEIPYIINKTLVRGLDYYNHTAFEITSNLLGAQSTICGGGRYDGLVEQLGGISTPAIGWAMGMERLMLILENDLKTETNPLIYVVNKGIIAEKVALIVARKLRLMGLDVTLDSSSASFSKQFKRANRLMAGWAVVIGDNEANANEIILKNLHSKNKSNSDDTDLHIPTTELDSLLNLVRVEANHV